MMVNIYLAGGWFTPNTREILDKIESRLSNIPDINLYSPRRDGIMLPPNQKHDTKLRESIFKENISNITSADFVFAIIDSHDSYNDPGTIYEIGYAMAHGIPVIGFALDYTNITERFKGIINGFRYIIYGYDALEIYLQEKTYTFLNKESRSKVLFVGTGVSEDDDKLVSILVDNEVNLRWVNEMHEDIYEHIDNIFEDIDYMIAVVDDRKTLVSWMIGQAYARGIPVVTYSNYNYMINVMLLVSVRTHIRGVEELQEFLRLVELNGFDSVPQFDISDMSSC